MRGKRNMRMNIEMEKRTRRTIVKKVGDFRRGNEE